MAAMHAGMNEEMSDDEVNAFHRALDALVHKHLGTRPGEIEERKLTKAEKVKREKNVKGLKKHKDDFEKRYGDDAESVMYAVATKRAKGESIEEGKDFGMFNKVSNDVIENGISYIIRDFSNAADVRGANRELERYKAHEALNKMLEEMSEEEKYAEAYDTEVREKAHDYLENAIIKIMDFLDKNGPADVRAAKEKATEAKAKPGHNMMAMARTRDIIRKAIEDSKKKRGIKDDEEDKEKTNENFSGAIASVAMPLGKMQRRKKTTEAHPNSKVYDKCWDGYEKVPGKKRGEPGSCRKKD